MAYDYIIDWDDAEARLETLWNTPEALQSLSREIPPQDVIRRKLKHLLETDEAPKWYKYGG